jgi:hypothetical protein
MDKKPIEKEVPAPSARSNAGLCFHFKLSSHPFKVGRRLVPPPPPLIEELKLGES